MASYYSNRSRRCCYRCTALSFFLLLHACFLAGDCFGGIHDPPIEALVMSAFVIEKEGDSREYEVERGEAVILRLPENPTTGYRWEVEYLDDAILEPPDSVFSTADQPAVGAAGIRTFNFQTRAPGVSPLRLILKRSWEPQQQALDRFEITVRVRESNQ